MATGTEIATILSFLQPWWPTKGTITIYGANADVPTQEVVSVASNTTMMISDSVLDGVLDGQPVVLMSPGENAPATTTSTTSSRRVEKSMPTFTGTALISSISTAVSTSNAASTTSDFATTISSSSQTPEVSSGNVTGSVAPVTVIVTSVSMSRASNTTATRMDKTSSIHGVPSSLAQDPNQQKRLHDKRKRTIVLATVIPILVILLLIYAYWFLLRQRKRRRSKEAMVPELEGTERKIAELETSRDMAQELEAPQGLHEVQDGKDVGVELPG